jgi:hypothetical protein
VGKKLPQKEKWYTQDCSRQGMGVEHTICRLKNYRIIVEVSIHKQIEKVQQDNELGVKTSKPENISILFVYVPAISILD